jgi:hypothetical protein
VFVSKKHTLQKAPNTTTVSSECHRLFATTTTIAATTAAKFLLLKKRREASKKYIYILRTTTTNHWTAEWRTIDIFFNFFPSSPNQQQNH